MKFENFFKRNKNKSDAKKEVGNDVGIKNSEKNLEIAEKDMNEDNKENEIKKPYSESSEIEGVKISIGMDSMYNEYTIYFPDVKSDEEAWSHNINDSIMKVGKDSKKAEKVFEYAEQVARENNDVYEVYKKVRDFIYSQPEEEDVSNSTEASRDKDEKNITETSKLKPMDVGEAFKKLDKQIKKLVQEEEMRKKMKNNQEK